MKKLIFLLSAIFVSLIAYSQGVINTGANIVITANTYFYIDGGTDGDYTNTGAGTIDLDGTMIIEGDLTNTGTSNVFTNTSDVDGTVIFPSGTHTITANNTDVNGVITNFVDFEKVEIQSSSEVHVPSGSAITINGDLTLDGDLHLDEGSDPEAPTGSLILIPTTYSGTGFIHLHRTFKVGKRWQYISMPVNNATDDIFDYSPVTGNFNPNLYWYQESYDANPDPSTTDYSNWDSQTYEFYYAWYNAQVADQSATNTLEVGKGYITYNEANVQNEFIPSASELNIANSYDLTSYVSFTPNDGAISGTYYYDGWNLLGNPYQSAIDWDKLTRGTDLGNTVYIWDGDNGNYVYYNNASPDDHIQMTGQTLNQDNTARYISAFQGFFVKANGSSDLTFQIPKTAAVHVGNPAFKKSDDENIDKPDFTYFKLKISYDYDGQTLSDETIIRFWDRNATWTANDKGDAPKMFNGWNDVPFIYSTVTTFPTDIPLAFNTLPIENDEVDYVSIPLGIVAKHDGDYTVSLVDYNNLDFDRIYLVDAQDPDNPQLIDLEKQPSYQFYTNVGEYRGRLFLLGYYVNGSDPQPTDVLFGKGNDVKIYAKNSTVYLSIPNIEELNGTVRIFDNLGRNVYTGKALSTLTEINLNVASGTYIVKYNSPKKVYTEKVVLSL